MYSDTETRVKILFEDLVLQPSTGEVWRGEQSISLPKLSFKLLQVLAEAAPETLTQEQLISQIWTNSVVGDETLKQRVKLLRKALGDKASAPRYIGVVRGRGYRLIPDVKLQICQPPRLPEYVINERIPNFATVESMRIWKKMSFGLFVIISFLLIILYSLSDKISHQEAQYDPQNVAILSFVNTTQMLEDDYLAKGVTRELIKVLSEIDDLAVIPFEKVEVFASAERLVSNIANQLKVGSILDGALTRRNNRLFFRFKLINSQTMKVLWHQEYSAEPNELLTLQRNVITEIVEHLKAELTPSKRINALVLTQPNRIAKAYDIYLRGLDYYYRYHAKDNLIAIKLFKQAIADDDSFSDAHAGLADAYSQAVYQFGADDLWRQLALESAQSAVELYPQNEVAHKAKALALYLNGHIRLAIQSSLNAVKLRPSFVQATTNLGFLYRESGQLEKALEWNQRTLEIDPNYAPGYVHFALTQASMGELSKAELSFKQALQLKPDYLLAIKKYAMFLATQGRFEEARELLLDDQTGDNFSRLMTAGDVELLAERYLEAWTFYHHAAELGEVKNNIRLELTLALCDRLVNRTNLELQQKNTTINEPESVNNQLNELTRYFVGHVESTKSENVSDFLLLSMAYSVLDNQRNAKTYLQSAMKLGQVDEHFIQKHPLLQKLLHE